MKLEIEFIIKCMGGTLVKGSSSGWVDGVSIDSRTIVPGQMFFALPGETQDGHNFVGQALAAGAAAVVISNPAIAGPISADRTVIQVRDTLTALQMLAAGYRQFFNIPIVAVTGSVGKTTTKDILAACLGRAYETLKTPGNYNNEIGLPLTLLQLEPAHGAAVVELAMRAQGEIARLASIAKPTCAVITNIAPVHLETLGTMENIARSKCEVLEFLSADQFALINGDSALLLEIASQYPCRKFTFGYNENCDFQILGTELAGAGINVRLRLLDSAWVVHFPVPAVKLAVDVAAAVSAAYLLGLNMEEIRGGLESYRSGIHRLNIINLSAGGVVIDDTYNANPVSMSAALEVCKDISAGRRTVAVLGDMAELGDFEKEGHLQVGRQVAKLGLNMLLAVGPRAADIAQGAIQSGMPVERVQHFPDQLGGREGLLRFATPKDAILFKASRSMKLEEMVQFWLSAAENGGPKNGA